MQHLCLWIDPLDCTLGYVKGNVEDVTVLIGLSYKQKPVAGVIGTPFKAIANEKVFDPIVTIGSVKSKETYDFFGKEWKRKQTKYPLHSPIKVVTSNSRSTAMERDLLRVLGAQNIKAGGSGRKV